MRTLSRLFKTTPGSWHVLLVLLALLAGYVMLAQALPFDPYRIVAYRAIPDKACAGTAIALSVTRELTPAPWQSVSGYVMSTYWEQVGGRTRTPLETFTGSFARARDGRLTGRSAALRSTPDTPGHYRIVTEYLIKGRVLGYPRTHRFTFVSPQVLEIIEEGSCS